jgi:hypothetical protein
MSKQTINIGASPNDGTGTPLRTSFDYTNQNFTELYTALGGGVGLPGATTQVIFNDGGTNLAGDAGLVYNKTTDALTVAGLVTAGSATITGDLTVDTSTLKVDSANNRVGIGTASPNYILDILGAAPRIHLKDNGTGSSLVDIENGAGTLFVGRENSTGSSGLSGVPYAGIMYLQGAYPLIFGTNLTERARLNSTGAFVLAGGTTTADGIGVAFPTTQVASSDANCLDDYEEGTFTPTVGGSISNGTAVYTKQIGLYTKIGRIVQIQIFVEWNTGTATGTQTVIGLPFTSNSTTDNYSILNTYPINISLTALNIATSSIPPGNSIVNIYQLPTGGGSDSNVPCDAAGAFLLTGTYTAA